MFIIIGVHISEVFSGYVSGMNVTRNLVLNSMCILHRGLECVLGAH